MSAISYTLVRVNEDFLRDATDDTTEYRIFTSRAVVDKEGLPTVRDRRRLPKGRRDHVLVTNLVDRDRLVTEVEDAVIRWNVPMRIGKVDGCVSVERHDRLSSGHLIHLMVPTARSILSSSSVSRLETAPTHLWL